MKRHVFVFGAMALLGGWVLAQSQDDPYVFRDVKGNFRLWNTENWSKEDDDKGNSTLEAFGTPVRGESKNQGLVLAANHLKAFLRNEGKGQLTFEWADLDGSVDVVQARTTKDGKVSRKLTTERLRLEEGAEAATTKLPVSFVVTDKLDPSGAFRPRTLVMKGSSGTIVSTRYQQQGENELRSADVTGSTVTLSQGVLPGESEPTTSTSTAVSSSMKLKKAENYLLTFTSKVDFTDDRTIKKEFGDATQHMTMSGGSGVITLEDLQGKSKQPVISAVMSGGVSMVLESMSPIKDDIEYLTVNVKGTHMTFDRATFTIHIEGNVTGSYSQRKKSDNPDDVMTWNLKNDAIDIVLTEDFRKVKSVKGTKGSAGTGGGG